MAAPDTTRTNLSALPVLRQVLRQAVVRIRARRAILGGANGLLIGAVVAGVAVGLLRLGLYEEDTLPHALYLGPPLTGVTVGILWGAMRRLQPFAAAQIIEQRLDLKERLSSALAFVSHAEDAFSLRQREDAEFHAGKIHAATVLPLIPLPPRVIGALTATVTVFLIWLLPTLPAFQSPAVRAEHVLVKKEGERLVRIARAAEKSSAAKKLEATRRAAAQIARLGSQMQSGQMPRRKALMKVAKLTDQIKQAQQALATQAGDPNNLGIGKSLASAARDLQRALDAAKKKDMNSGLAADGNNGENAAASEGRQQADSAMKAAQKALSENNSPSLTEQLNRLADTVSRGEPKEDGARQSLAAQIEALSKALKGTNLEKAAPDLADAARALRQGELPRAAELLREAARKAAEAGASSEDARALSQMAQALQGSPEGDGTEQEISAEQMAQGAAGESGSDAFNADGSRKGDQAEKGAASGSRGRNGTGDSEGKEPGNGIGTSAGKVGGERIAGKRSAYTDSGTAPAVNRKLNRPMQKTPITSDKGLRLSVPVGNTTRVAGKRGDKGREMVSYTRGAPEKAAASVPYYEVYGKYAPTAEKALNREDIPATYKKQVREYFDALRPSGKGN